MCNCAKEAPQQPILRLFWYFVMSSISFFVIL